MSGGCPDRFLDRGARLAVLLLACLAGCGPPKETFTGEPFLVVWAGDADRQNADFLAVLDADPGSPSYGKVLQTYPVRSRGNEPGALIAPPRSDRRLFATGLLTNRTFVFDFRDPLAARLLHVDEPGPQRQLWAPHDVVTLPNGHVAVTCPDRARYRGEAREVLGAPGGLVELDAGGLFVREVSGAQGDARSLIVAPTGAAASAALGRLVTANRGHGYVATTAAGMMPGISVQIWRLADLALEKTVVLDAGPRGEENLGPLEPCFLHQRPLVYVSTHDGGGLYASDSIGQPAPAFKLVTDFGAGALAAGTAITPDDRFYVAALTGKNRLITLDLGDPWHPRQAGSLRFDRDPVNPGQARVGKPAGLTLSADGTRVAVADYTIDVPGERIDGDHRVYLVRLDPATGQLRFDNAFRDELTGEVGVDFNRTRWPHGDTGAARPLALLFVTAEPPAERRR